MSNVWDRPAPVARAFVRFPQPWQKLMGLGFGMRERIVSGFGQVRLPEAIDLAGLEAAIAPWTGEALPEDIGGESDAERLVTRAAFWVGALQRQAQIPVFGRAFIQAAPTPRGGADSFRIALPCYDPRAAFAALEWVEKAINAFLEKGGQGDAPGEATPEARAALVDTLKAFSPEGVNLYRLLSAAHQLGIPARHFVVDVHTFGYGARSRWLASTFTDRTSAIASQFAGDKMATAHILRRAGLPGAVHARVGSAEEAVQTAQRIGYPVVVKPADRQQGLGVAANLNSDAEVADAYRAALEFSQNILVERHFDGIDHRMTVVNGRLIRVRARLPGGVTGDGTHSVAELVESSQAGQRGQRRARERGHQLLELDGEALGLLALKGLTPDHVPQKDEYVRLRRRGNVSAGATAETVPLDKVHPDNKLLAERAVAALGLDVGGVDFIIPNISRSWMETGAHICEINGQPQIDRRAAPEVLFALMEKGGRIPILVVVGGEGLDWARLRGASARAGGGFAARAGAWLDGNRILPAQASAFDAAQALLESTETGFLVVHMSAEELAHYGLPADRCNALIFDAPDLWAPGARKSLGDLLRVVAMNTERILAVAPADCLRDLAAFAERIEPAKGTLNETCSEILRQLLAADAQDDGIHRAAKRIA